MEAAILVVRGGAIGDFILTLPVLAALRGQFPRCRLEVLGYGHIAALALAGGLADGLHPIDARPLASFFARGGPLDAGLASYFAGFAVVISYLYDPDGIFEANVRQCAPKTQFIAGPHRPIEAEARHATGVFLKPLERLAIFGADPEPRLRVQPKDGGEGAGRLGRVLAVHPGSGSESKNWPEHRWVEMMERLLAETPWGLLLVGGEAEGDRLERLSGRLGSDRVRLARSLPLVELATRLMSCELWVGHDTGITHLAAALGLRGVVLWGPSRESIWRPLSRRMRIVRAAEGLQALPVSGVLQEIRDLLACDEQA